MYLLSYNSDLNNSSKNFLQEHWNKMVNTIIIDLKRALLQTKIDFLSADQ